VRQLEADYSIGESEQKAEMTFGDFGASVSASALSAGKLYAAGRRGLRPASARRNRGVRL